MQVEDFSRYFTVSRAALRSQASPRVVELSQARIRTDNIEIPREYAFTVKPAALTFRPSERLVSLAQPLQRA